MADDISSGLNTEGQRVFFDQATPNAENNSQQYMSYSPEVEFSKESGEIEANAKIELSADDATIYYTTDGSTPTTDSKVYSQAITVSEPTVIRAFSQKNNCLPSKMESNSYLAGIEHDLPIISLSTNNENMFGSNGIYDNWSDTIENPVHIEFFETNGLAFDIDAGFEIYGSTSQEEDQKSFAIHLRKEYGQTELEYPLFEGNDVTNFKHFLLRTSGQDWAYTKVRDSFFQEAIQDVIDVDSMDTRPCVVYINGKYWGLYG